MVRSKVLDDVARDTMTLDELCARLNISLTTGYERASRDALPIPRIPGLKRHLFSRRLYDRLMETGTLDTGDPGKAA